MQDRGVLSLTILMVIWQGTRLVCVCVGVFELHEAKQCVVVFLCVQAYGQYALKLTAQ